MSVILLDRVAYAARASLAARVVSRLKVILNPPLSIAAAGGPSSVRSSFTARAEVTGMRAGRGTTVGLVEGRA